MPTPTSSNINNPKKISKNCLYLNKDFVSPLEERTRNTPSYPILKDENGNKVVLTW